MCDSFFLFLWGNIVLNCYGLWTKFLTYGVVIISDDKKLNGWNCFFENWKKFYNYNKLCFKFSCLRKLVNFYLRKEFTRHKATETPHSRTVQYMYIKKKNYEKIVYDIS